MKQIEDINKQLIDHFGIATDSNKPIFRIVWSEDQYEKRLVQFTPEGIELLYAQVMLCPKYPWLKDQWILERLEVVPEQQQIELAGEQISYEPKWAFPQGVMPVFWACKLVVDTLYAALGKKSLVKYVDEEAKNPVEHREARIKKMEEELFGDESFLLGRTITGEAVAYTGEPKIQSGEK